jgi:hypothetical protein
LQVVSQVNEASASGGVNLLTNPFTAYAVNPAKVPAANVEGAKAFLDYLTSPEFQARLAAYPNASSPAFFADAHPRLTAGQPLSGVVKAGAAITVSGTVTNLLPGSPPVAGQSILLQRAPAGPIAAPTFATVASGLTAADGSYRLQVAAFRGGQMRVEMPTTSSYPSLALTPLIAVGSLARTDLAVGSVSVRSAIGIGRPRVKGHTVQLQGRVGPSSERDGGARLVILGRAEQARKLRALHRVRLPRGSHYNVHVKLGSGRWKLRVRYRDPGAILPATSRAVSVSVP